MAYLLEKGKPLEEITLAELRQFSEHFEEDVFRILSPEGSADRKKVYGGTAKEEVLRQIEVAKKEEGL